MMNSKLAASSCAVIAEQATEDQGAKLRVLLTFMSVANFFDVRDAFIGDPNFPIDKEMTSSGSTLVLVPTSRNAFELSAQIEAKGLSINPNRIEFVNGTTSKCSNVREAVQRAFDYL